MKDLVLDNSRLASTGIRARSCSVKGGKVQVGHGCSHVIDKHSKNLAFEILISKLCPVIFALLGLKPVG
jgi:hypothetical protein